MVNIHIRFYEELNDFLPSEMHKTEFVMSVAENTGIKDVIESLSVPHTEVDLILVNNKSVDFNYKIKKDDYISVYPVFESLDISEIIRLRPKPLRHMSFILDVHLGKLARYLRLLGFDTIYQNDFADKTIIERSVAEKRIILTRDIGLLKNKKVTHGYWIRQTDPHKQIKEVLTRFDLLSKCQPFTRCIECNGILEKISKNEIIENILPNTIIYYQEFSRCTKCKRIYWKGTHYKKLQILVEKFLDV